MIPVDYDQAAWGSSRIYGDGALSGLWIPDKVVVHWGGSTVPPATLEGEMRLLRGWQRFHIRTRGWRDLAYNYAIGNATGSRFRGRGWNPSGATSGDYEGDGIRENAEAVACVWLGGSGGPISTVAYRSMARLVSDILAVVDNEPDVVIGHRDVKGTTTCPGDEWAGWIQAEGWLLAPRADEEEEIMIRATMQAQNPEFFEWLQTATTYPKGNDPGYWGRTGQPGGPSDAEWDNPTDNFPTVLDELFTAAISVGALHGHLPPPTSSPSHDHDGQYAPTDHPHTASTTID